MIQFNLLPDIKQQYIKATRVKRTALVVSFLVAVSSLFIFIALFLSVHVFQQRHLEAVNNDIKTNTQKLKDLGKVLTIQNQLNSLPELHKNKPVATRLSGYLSQITPTQINIGELEVDFNTKTMKIIGTADSLQSVNKFVDTMKFTTYTDLSSDSRDSQTKPGNPFTSVVLDTFTRTDKDATYQITLVFDSAIFDNGKNVTLTVPKITSTRSETEKPTELFKALPEIKKQ